MKTDTGTIAKTPRTSLKSAVKDRHAYSVKIAQITLSPQ